MLFASLHGVVAASSFSDNFTISVAYVATLYATIAISSVPFVYRYFALCRCAVDTLPRDSLDSL